ncbi:hypothetical protein [Streptomyces iconiensis]|uniref:DUF3618 domain-containing protein n=1 Tax=Streptomyces iconiensis TaxID=1384038 RepID=A0ABT7A4C5_9ACTN|nr:hypothetical protein [Streptomyces iconiensis]MDJ1136204.1 hypothetical protein [Streptomyces iconiensis]
MTEPRTEVAIELERLRASVDVGLARVDGSLALLVQRSEQTDQRLTDAEQRLATLERSRWPLPAMAVLVAVSGLLLSLWQAAQ